MKNSNENSDISSSLFVLSYNKLTLKPQKKVSPHFGPQFHVFFLQPSKSSNSPCASTE